MPKNIKEINVISDVYERAISSIKAKPLKYMSIARKALKKISWNNCIFYENIKYILHYMVLILINI